MAISASRARVLIQFYVCDADYILDLCRVKLEKSLEKVMSGLLMTRG
jgi:hypothetical protein